MSHDRTMHCVQHVLEKLWNASLLPIYAWYTVRGPHPHPAHTCIYSAHCLLSTELTGCTYYRAPDYFIKGSYGRSAGSARVCSSDKVNNDGLCYKPCASGSKGVGPLCWDNTCTGTAWPYQCGQGLCTKDKTGCAIATSAIGLSAGLLIGGVAVCVFSAGTACGIGGAMIEVGVDTSIGIGTSIRSGCK